MKGGPTVRTPCGDESVDAPLGAAVGAAAVPVPAGVAALLAGLPGAPFAGGGCDKALAFCSLTTISPRSSVEESSASLSASAQLCPGRRQEQPATTTHR